MGTETPAGGRARPEEVTAISTTSRRSAGTGAHPVTGGKRRPASSSTPSNGSMHAGAPNLPASIAWPTYDGISMSFLAQIDLGESGDGSDGLPPTGVLYFFYERGGPGVGLRSHTGDATGYNDPRAAALRETETDWVQLLAVDTDDAANMMWGDMGRGYFMIRKQDLAARDFDAVWLVSQCY